MGQHLEGSIFEVVDAVNTSSQQQTAFFPAKSSSQGFMGNGKIYFFHFHIQLTIHLNIVPFFIL